MKKIIHIDMDAFYASVEQRDNPELKGKPVIVGGSPDSRGVVASCSYEARKFGIHSAMPSSQAYRLCPRAVFVRGRFDAYQEVSGRINDIFNRYTSLVEPLSLDEAYLDVTHNWEQYSSATCIAENIRHSIENETGLTASAGVSFNKFLAKVASDCNKPNGITVVTPSRAESFIEALPVRKFFGVGKATEKKMHQFKIYTGNDLKKMELAFLVHHFGKSGQYYYNIVRGIDHRQVETGRIRKSIGKENTFGVDIHDTGEMHLHLQKLAASVACSMEKRELRGKVVTLKVKYHDFKQVTRSMSLSEATSNEELIFNLSKELLQKTKAKSKPVRLLGISLSSLDSDNHEKQEEQLSFSFN